jgi:hypothetical protein
MTYILDLLTYVLYCNQKRRLAATENRVNAE